LQPVAKHTRRKDWKKVGRREEALLSKWKMMECDFWKAKVCPCRISAIFGQDVVPVATGHV
jgi:hypothetical protein